MLQDSLTLAAGGTLSSLPVPSGTTLPTGTITPWCLFQLTAVQGANQPGTFIYNGTAWVKFIPDAVAPTTPVYPHDINVFLPGKPANSEVLVDYIAGRAFTLDAVTGKVGVVGTGANTVFTFTKNGTSIGTVSFPNGQLGNPTVTVAATSFAVNDVLKVTAPATANAALADVVLYLKGHVT